MWATFLMCFFFTLLSARLNKKIVCPMTIFFGLWAFITCIYSLKLFELYDVGNKTVSIISIGILFFAIGGVVGQNTKIYKLKNFVLVPDNILLPTRRYYFFLIITILLLSTSAINGLFAILRGASLHDIRYFLREDILSDESGLLSALFLYLASPMSILIIHYNSVRLLYRRSFKEALITNAIILILNELTVGGRLMILYFGLDMLLIIYMWIREKNTEVNKIKKRENKRRKKIIIVMVVVIALLICIITVNSGSKILSTIYYYSCGCIPHLENKLSLFDGNYTYGFTSFDGFIRPFAVIFQTMGIINELPVLVEQAEKHLLLVEEICQISSTGYYNGFISPFYSFYVDGGYIYVALLSLFWGWIVTRNYKKILKTGNSKNMLIYFLLMQMLAFSMLRFMFNDYKYAMAFLYYLFIFADFGSGKKFEIKE